MTEIKIDKDVPIPTKHFRGPKKYPLRELAVGESFFCEGDKVRSAAYQWGRTDLNRQLKRKFMCRTTTENGIKGTRVWRIA